MIKHIIWDWNGTLLDDLDVSMEALNYVLEKENLPLVLDKEEYRKYFQFPVIEYYKKWALILIRLLFQFWQNNIWIITSQTLCLVLFIKM